ncbi:MAG: GNAT family N-acetyltransferase [Chloroflexi bacterium]|nr:GNAT family N-acetyltransferase [Chloroflexota bacterium]
MSIYTSRTVIRSWNRYDDERSYRWPPYHDPFEAVWNLQRSVSPFSTGWFSDMIAARRHWAVDSRSGDLMGRISLRDIDNTLKQARLGITFSASYVGRGLGTEAMHGFLDYFFGELGFHIMVLDVAAINERAVRSYRSLGFVYVESDWRNAYHGVDMRLFESAPYAHLKPHVRVERDTMWIEFFEMRLTRDMWIHHTSQSHQRENNES